MSAQDPEQQRKLAARHEAGHAVAALHYGCPIEFTSIERVGIAHGTTRMRLEEPEDAIVLLCGPLAEKDWEVYVPGTMSPIINTYGPDEEAIRLLALKHGELRNWAFRQALAFISQHPVQEQIDRVARGLLEHTRLMPAQVLAISGFSQSLSGLDK